MTNSKTLDYYMGLHYTLVIRKHDDATGKYFSARWLELDGCMTIGETIEELHRNAEEAKEGWLSVKLDFGDPIPEPLTHDEIFNLQKQLTQRT